MEPENNMSAPKLFQFPNTVTVDLNQIQKTSHVYFRYANARVTDCRAFFIKLRFHNGAEEEFYISDDEAGSKETQRLLIDRWASDK